MGASAFSQASWTRSSASQGERVSDKQYRWSAEWSFRTSVSSIELAEYGRVTEFMIVPP
ncbi:hypothetical protein D3C72_2387970 [compost metagenome]